MSDKWCDAGKCNCKHFHQGGNGKNYCLAMYHRYGSGHHLPEEVENCHWPSKIEEIKDWKELAWNKYLVCDKPFKKPGHWKKDDFIYAITEARKECGLDGSG